MSWDMKEKINMQPSCFASQPRRPPTLTWASPGPKQSGHHLLNVNQGFKGFHCFGEDFWHNSTYEYMITLHVWNACTAVCVIKRIALTMHLKPTIWHYPHDATVNLYQLYYAIAFSLSHCFGSSFFFDAQFILGETPAQCCRFHLLH